jgi:hypothetical protein
MVVFGSYLKGHIHKIISKENFFMKIYQMKFQKCFTWHSKILRSIFKYFLLEVIQIIFISNLLLEK